MNIGIDSFLQEQLKVTQKNIYIGNGITLAFDQKYKRILLTVKNYTPPPTVTVKLFQDTDEFFNSLVIGDIVNYNGRYVEYKGINDPEETGFECTADPEPEDSFRWVALEFICELDEPVTVAPFDEPGDFTGLSSPGVVQQHPTNGAFYIGDHDDPVSNFYSIAAVGGRTSYGGSTTIYNFIKDKTNSRIFGSAAVGGMKVFDILTQTVTTVPYGSDVALSRDGMWIVENNIMARDRTTASITTIDRTTLNVIAVKLISAIPSGATYLTGEFSLLYVENEIWVIPNKRAAGGIARYSLDLSTLLGTFDLPAQLTVPDWGDDEYMQQAFYDVEGSRVYIHDTGSSQTFVYDRETIAVLETFEWFKADTIEGILMEYFTDPITGALYLNYKGRDATDFTDLRVYIMDRLTSEILRMYPNKTLLGDLERDGSTIYMRTAVPGNKSWEGGSWGADGSINQYSHGEIPIIP
jgi:hypothetical protein